MNLFIGVLTLVTALVISGVAGFFSVIGLGHLFAGAFWPVVVMGTALEVGKLVTASWLKANWANPLIARQHRLILLTQVVVLMLITSLGIYGYLAKGHLEQEASLPAVSLRIGQSERRIAQISDERGRLEDRLKGLDQAVNVLLANAKTSRETQAADRARQAQRKDRIDIAKQIATRDVEVNKLNDELVPLRLQVADVSAKLGPVKYVAQLFGWQDPNSAVQMVILMIMFAFDPLAVMLVLSGTLTIGEWMRQRNATTAHALLKTVALTDMASHLDAQSSGTPTAKPKDEIADAAYFTRKFAEASAPPPSAASEDAAQRPFGGVAGGVGPLATTPLPAVSESIAAGVENGSNASVRSMMDRMSQDLALAIADRSSASKPRTSFIDTAILRGAMASGSPETAGKPTARFAAGAWGALGATATSVGHTVDLGVFEKASAPHKPIAHHSTGQVSANFPGTVTSYALPTAIAPEILTSATHGMNSKPASVGFHEFSESMFRARDK